MKVKVTPLDERFKDGTFKLPTHATKGSAAVDLIACLDNDKVVGPNQTLFIPAGISMAVPEGYGAFLLPRSGLGANDGIILSNTVGLIDSDYRGPVGISLWNRSNAPFEVKVGMRICQMVVIKVEEIELEMVDELDETERGEGGFGHSGV